MVYEYTKPRGPVAAMQNSPGPAYGLPSLIGDQRHDPRSIHKKEPSHSFGVRWGKGSRSNTGPGPAYFPDPKMLRSGKDNPPSYSLYARLRAAATYRTPGPGAYRAEDSGYASRTPAYSFGTKHRLHRNDNTPAANSYMVPTVIGGSAIGGKPSAPKYTLSGRQQVKTSFVAPGPGAYKISDINVSKPKAPLYSMTARTMRPGDISKKPGPGAYRPEDATCCIKECGPCFSFGIKHSPYTTTVITEPNPTDECVPEIRC